MSEQKDASGEVWSRAAEAAYVVGEVVHNAADRLYALGDWLGRKSLRPPQKGDSATNLPLHRTEAGYPNCSTCDGGGCLDCTDPA